MNSVFQITGCGRIYHFIDHLPWNTWTYEHMFNCIHYTINECHIVMAL